MNTMVYAGFWRRFLAHVIDSVILNIALWIVMMVVGLSVGGILAGQSLVKNAEHRSMEQQLEGQSVDPTSPGVTYEYAPQANEMMIAQTAGAGVTSTPGVISEPVAAPTPSTMIDTPMPTQAAPMDQGMAPVAPQEAAPSTAMPMEAPAADPYASGAPSYSESYSETPMRESGTVPPYTHDPAMSSPEGAGLIGGALAILLYVFLIAIFALYHTLFTSSKFQATPGKMAMGCVVVTREGKRLTFWHAFGRYFACALSWLPFPPICIGFYLAGWTREKTALHDMIASTRVVRTASEAPVIALKNP
jgi:uncharacterized RDD family membrane protein YckC